jgi:hypothetical protein
VVRSHGNDNGTVQTAMQLWPSLHTLVIASVYHIFHNFPRTTTLTTLFLWHLPAFCENTSAPIYLDMFLGNIPALETLTIIHISRDTFRPNPSRSERLAVPVSNHPKLTNIRGPPPLLYSLVPGRKLDRVHISWPSDTDRDESEADDEHNVSDEPEFQAVHAILPMLIDIPILVIELAFDEESNDRLVHTALKDFRGNELVLAAAWHEPVSQNSLI